MLALDVSKIISESTVDGNVNLSTLASKITDGVRIAHNGLPTINSTEFIHELGSWTAGNEMVSHMDIAAYLSSKYNAECRLLPVYRIDNPSPHINGCGKMLSSTMVNDIVEQPDIERIILNILASTNKRNVLLVGNTGVGKRSICRSVARKIIEYNCPYRLWGRRVYELSPNTLVGENGRIAIDNLLDDILPLNDIVIVPELQTIISSSVSNDNKFNIPIPSSPKLPMICTCTREGFSMVSMLKLHERMVVVDVKEPDDDTLARIVELHAKLLSSKYKFTINTDNIIEASRKIRNVSNPLSSISIMDLAASDMASNTVLNLGSIGSGLTQSSPVSMSNIQLPNGTLSNENITRAISILTKSSTDIDSVDRIQRARDLPKQLKESVVHQDTAIDLVCSAINRSLVFKKSTEPIGIMLFLGSSGVGKTYLARKIAEHMFNNKLLILDMSEFTERHTISRLVGSPAGYIGYGEGGELTNYLSSNPSSVILLDEIEKAHDNMYKLLLGIVNEGVISDMRGVKVPVADALIILTSNLGTRHIVGKKNAIGFKTEKEDVTKEVMRDVAEHFSPEFRDRLTATIIFNELKESDVETILDLELAKLPGPRITMTPAAKGILMRDWKEGEGARSVSRLISSNILGPISQQIIEGKLEQGSGIVVYVNKDVLAFRRDKNG